MTANHRRAIMLVSVLGLCIQLSCSRRSAPPAAELEFDATGNLVALSGPDGKKTSFHYDSRGLPIEVVSPDGPARYGYDAHGNRIWARGETGTTEYYYDAFDRLSAVIWDRGPKRLIAYEYDHVGRISRISVFNLRPLENVPSYSKAAAQLAAPGPSDSSGWHARERQVLALADRLRAVAAQGAAPWLANDVSYVRSLRGDLEEIRSDMGTVRFLRSDDGRRVERILPNGVHSVFEYASDRHLSSLRHVDSAGREIASFSYNYGPNGRLQGLSGGAESHTSTTDYVWDPRGRLQEMDISDGAKFHYKYDEGSRRLAVTNRGKTVTFFFDALGRVSRAQGIVLGATVQGAIVARRGDGETTEIRYNHQSLPAEIRTGKARLRYIWDSEGNLVSRVENGKTVNFVPAAGTRVRLPLLEYGEDGAPESKQLIDQSILGRVGAGAAQYYLEGPSGDAGYIVNEQGLLMDDSSSHAASPRAPLSTTALIPASFVRSRLGHGRISAPLLLAQSVSSQAMPDLSDVWWQEFERSLWAAATTAGNWDARADQKLSSMNAWGDQGMGTAGLFWNAVGVVGVWGSAWGGSVLGDAQDIREKYDTYWAHPDFGKNLGNLLQPVGMAAWDVFGGEVLGSIEKGITIPLESVYTKMLYKSAVQNRLDSLITTGGLRSLNESVVLGSKGLVTSFRNKLELLDTTLNTVVKSVETMLDLNNARNIVLAAKPSTVGSGGSPKQLGGIELSTTASVQGDIGSISGAVYDPASGSIVLLSDKDDATVSGIKAEDFAVALRLAYSQSPEDASFSLDPADPRNPEGPWLQKVYYPVDVLAGTGFGKALFEADWILKQYSFGVVAEQGQQQRMRISAVPGYKSVAALSFEKESKANDRAVMSRFWIVSGEMKIRRDGSSIVFDKAAMGVKTKRQVRDPNSKTGLRDDDSVKDPIHQEFARRFTEHYDDLAAEAPELERVRDLAKAVAIAKWLRENNVAVDLAGTDKMALQADDPEAYRRVPALSTTFKQVQQKAIHDGNREGVATLTREIYLFGGVDLKSTPQYVPDPSLGQLQKAVQDELKEVAEPRFDLTYGNRSWTGTVLPLTGPALERSAKASSVVRNGVVYRVDAHGQVQEVVDRSGNCARYRNPAMGMAGGVEITGKDGWKAIAQPRRGGAFVQIATSRGNEVEVVADSAGAIQSIAVDGRTWAEYHSQGNVRSVRLNQGNYAEVLTYDGEGRITGYQLERPAGPGPVSTETANIEYSADGHPSRLSGTGIPETQWQYDGAGRVQQVASSNGANTRVSYDDEVAQTTVERRTGAGGDLPNGTLPKLVFENKRLVRSESAQTGKVDYKYANHRIVSVKGERSGEIHFSYDRNGRPESVCLPSGVRVQYRFPNKGKTGSPGATGFKIQVMGPGASR